MNTRDHVVQNVRKFSSLQNGDLAQKNFHRSVLKNGKKFVALIESKCIRYAPAHYAIAPDSQLENLVQKQTISQAKVSADLSDISGSSIEPGSPLYDLIDGNYVNACEATGDVPSQHHQGRTYWLVRP